MILRSEHKKLTFCVTGHRPKRLGGYSKRIKEKLLEVALDQIKSFIKEDETVLTGMALGWDTAIAMACMITNTSFTAVVPFKGQEKLWPNADIEAYNYLLDKASKVEILSNAAYSPHLMFNRDKWMVDRSDAIISLFDGECYGGTYETLRYAKKKGIVHMEAWSYWNAWELL